MKFLDDKQVLNLIYEIGLTARAWPTNENMQDRVI